MRYLLDTNTCIYIIKRHPPAVIHRLREADIGEVGVSSITLSELLHGIEWNSHPGRCLAALLHFLAPLEVLPYDDRAAESYARLRPALPSAAADCRLPLRPLDLLIAAHALALRSTLVTHNTREFARVPGLAVEDWTGP